MRERFRVLPTAVLWLQASCVAQAYKRPGSERLKMSVVLASALVAVSVVVGVVVVLVVHLRGQQQLQCACAQALPAAMAFTVRRRSFAKIGCDDQMLGILVAIGGRLAPPRRPPTEPLKGSFMAVSTWLGQVIRGLSGNWGRVRAARVPARETRPERLTVRAGTRRGAARPVVRPGLQDAAQAAAGSPRRRECPPLGLYQCALDPIGKRADQSTA